MNQIKKERIKSDLKRALAQVFLKQKLTNVVFTDILLSSDFRYATIEIDAINADANLVAQSLNDPVKYRAILQDLHKTLPIRNFPKIKFTVDSHKSRIQQIEELFQTL